MKKNKFFEWCGTLGTVLLLVGIVFKIQHYPFHPELLLAGGILFLVFWVWVFVELVNCPISWLRKLIWLVVVVLLLPVVGAWACYQFELKRIGTNES